MGLLINEIADVEGWWKAALLRHPLFQKQIDQARQSAREGKGISIEQLRVELNLARRYFCFVIQSILKRI